MAKPPVRFAAALLTLCLLLTACGSPGRQDVKRTAREAAVPALPELSEAPVGLTPIPVYLNGVLFTRGYERAGCLYVPPAPLCARAGVALSWEGDSKKIKLLLDSLSVEGRAGRDYLTASGRYLYAPEGWLTVGEDVFLPVHAVCRLFGLSAESGVDELRLSGSGLTLLQSSPDYYSLNFPEEDVYWLSHIISAEARGEPLEGQIAVGNVVLNRVRSSLFPDSVFAVIYDTEHAIQFEPIALGSILEDPTEEATIAACLALDGTELVGSCLYFVNPKYAGSWFDENLELAARIGRHNFYDRRG